MIKHTHIISKGIMRVDWVIVQWTSLPWNCVRTPMVDTWCQKRLLIALTCKILSVCIILYTLLFLGGCILDGGFCRKLLHSSLPLQWFSSGTKKYVCRIMQDVRESDVLVHGFRLDYLQRIFDCASWVRGLYIALCKTIKYFWRIFERSGLGKRCPEVQH